MRCVWPDAESVRSGHRLVHSSVFAPAPPAEAPASVPEAVVAVPEAGLA